MNKLILHNRQAPGDVVMLTAAVRDLHVAYPGQFQTDVRTPFPELWQLNPNITPLDDNDPEVKHVKCEYPLIHQSNQAGCHFVYGFMDFLNQKLNLNIKPTAVKGDIYLSAEEQDRQSALHPYGLVETPYWIIVAGGKYDFTIKWWSHERFQEVVDALDGNIHFVQIGRTGHEYHPPLNKVTDLRNKTNLRDLIRLMHHAEGVLCPVTLAMHLAAAVPTPEGAFPSRPCVAIAGGREPLHWEAYPNHQYVHTIGSLKCCATGGCWKARTIPLGDDHAFDEDRNLCVDVVEPGMARCMHQITAAEVRDRIALYKPILSSPQLKP